MGNTNQYLNDLYSELITNSPQTVSLDIPSALGTGRISQITTKQGVIVSDWKMNYISDVNVQGLNNNAYIHIIFCLNEGVSWGMMGEHYAVTIQKGEPCIYRGHGKMEYTCYTKQCDFQFKSIKIPFAYFSNLLNDYFEKQEIFVYEEKLFSSTSKVTITPNMERILAEVRDFIHYRGGLGYLYLEGKILELLSIYLSEVLELSILMSGHFQISGTDRASIAEAKRIIDSQLAYAPRVK